MTDLEAELDVYKKFVLDNNWVKWKPLWPSPDRSPQTDFLMCPALEAMYGGAGGGGKTVAMLAASLMFIDVPGYNALLLRRTFPDLNLPKALMDLSHKWLDGTDARWDAVNHTWTFPSGAKLVFGYCEHEGDEQHFRSAEFQFIGVDEVTEWAESQYTFLFSRLRKPKDLPVPLRMRCATNPGGKGHKWVKQRFLVEGQKDRVFIPAYLSDNPELDQESYRLSLSQLDPTRRRQILEGDWEASAGTLFQRSWFPIVKDYPRDSPVVRFWDKAASAPKPGRDPDWTAGAKVTVKNGQYYIIDIQRFQGSPKTNEDTIKQTAQLDGVSTAVVMEQEPGSSGVDTIDHFGREVLVGYNFRGERSTGSKEERAGPVASAAEAGNIYLVEGNWISEFLDELEVFPSGGHDDQVDAVSGAIHALAFSGPLGGDSVESIF